jgi:WD40 repeat protein
MKKFISLALLFTFLMINNCTPSVERYKNKARKALQKEDSPKALEYLQMAFEESLDDEFYPVGKRHNYSGLYVSVNRNKLVLTENQPSKSKSYFTVFEAAKNDDWKRRVKGYIRNVGVSPNGNYSVFNIEGAVGNCRLELWDLQKKEQLFFSRAISCTENAGVSDTGQVIFTGAGNSVMSYDLKTNTLDEKYIASLPEAPMKNIPARGAFQFSPGNSLYYTFGSMGLYHLYNVKNKQMNLVSKDGSYGKIFFLPGSDNPGLITGGANAHQVNFFAANASYGQNKTFPIRYWKDAVFISDREYYFIEDNRLVYVNQEKENKLSFWASVLCADAGGKIYFLSPQGKLMSYHHIDPDENSRSIFQLGWEIK